MKDASTRLVLTVTAIVGLGEALGIAWRASVWGLALIWLVQNVHPI